MYSLALRLLRVAPLLAVLALLPHSHAAATGPNIQLSSSKWNEGDTITVTGMDLYGEYIRQKKLCFSPESDAEDLTCFGHYDQELRVWVNDDDPYLLRWDRSILTFKVPPVVPPRGVLKLQVVNSEVKCFGSAGCIESPLAEEMVLGQFIAVPRIDAVIDLSSGLPAVSIEKGRTYAIEGVLFGSDRQTVSVGSDKSRGNGVATYTTWTPISAGDVGSWSNMLITFTASQNYDVTRGLKVNNSAVDSNVVLALAGSNSSSSSTRSSASERPSSTSSSSFASSVRSSSNTEEVFTDVPANHPYAQAIAWGKASGVLEGYPDGSFQLERAVNRAEFLKIVLASQRANVGSARLESGLRDVDESAWYAPYVRYAKGLGIVQGYPDGTFRPDQPVKFAEGLKIAYSAFNIETVDVAGNWFDRYLSHAAANDVLFSTEVQMDAGMSRKDVVWVVWKLLSHQGDWKPPVLPPAASPARSASFGDGTFIVGTDIAPGTYRTNGGANCYYARLSGFGGTLGEIITNSYSDAASIVTIAPADRGFTSLGCGTWRKVE